MPISYAGAERVDRDLPAIGDQYFREHALPHKGRQCALSPALLCGCRDTLRPTSMSNYVLHTRLEDTNISRL